MKNTSVGGRILVGRFRIFLISLDSDQGSRMLRYTPIPGEKEAEIGNVIPPLPQTLLLRGAAGVDLSISPVRFLSVTHTTYTAISSVELSLLAWPHRQHPQPAVI